jgi:hypothetical protein
MENPRTLKHSAVIARSEATKQSITTRRVALDCHALYGARNDAIFCATFTTLRVAPATTSVTPAPLFVTPAQAGAQRRRAPLNRPWIPAFAGMTDGFETLRVRNAVTKPSTTPRRAALDCHAPNGARNDASFFFASAGMTDDPLTLSVTSVSSVVKQHFLEF